MEHKGVTFEVEEKAQPLEKAKFADSPYSKFMPQKRYYYTEETKSLVIESYGEIKSQVIKHHGHGLFATIFEAFAKHYNLALKPDHLWQVILEGFAIHVKNNAEELRSKFVSFEGKKKNCGSAR